MTNITNPYLSAKAVAKKKTDIPVVLVCAIFAAATVSATITMFSQGKTLSGVMGIFLFAALITPVFRILRHAYRRACAHRIAGALLPLTEESLTFDQLGTVLSSSRALEQLRSLIGTGYLQNLQINGRGDAHGCAVHAGGHIRAVDLPRLRREEQRPTRQRATLHILRSAVRKVTTSPPGVHDSKKTADFRAKPGSIAHPNSPFQHSKERSPAFPLTSAPYFILMLILI